MTKTGKAPKAIFAEFDKDGSGELSYWEFSKGLKSIGCALPPKDAESIMKDLDADGSGEVSLEEVERAFGEIGSKSGWKQILTMVEEGGIDEVRSLPSHRCPVLTPPPLLPE